MSKSSSQKRPPDQRRKKKKPRREISEAARVKREDRLLDPTPLLLEAISKGLDAGYAEIDDADIPRANNVVEWLTSPEFLNIKPYAKQIQDAIHIFTGACYFCVRGSSLVSSDKGLVRLDRLPQERISRVGTTTGDRACTLWADKGTKTIREVETEAGFVAGATPDHKYKCLTEDGVVFLPLSAIKPGAYLLVKKGGPWPQDPVAFGPTVVRPRPGRQAWPKRPAHMTTSLARLLGYLVSEGYFQDRSYWFGNTNPHLLADFKACCKRLFGLDTFEDEARPNRSTTQLAICRSDVLDFLRQAGLSTQGDENRSGTKEVPWSILQSTRKHVIHFLRAYWEGDGWFSSSARKAGCGSKSYALARQIQLLLLRLGIVSKLRRDEESGVNGVEMWDVSVTGKYADVLAKTIGYVSPVYREIFESHGWAHAEMKPSKWDHNPFETLLPDDCIAQRVVRNEKLEVPDQVFDITVPHAHEFVADGFIAHNCSDTAYLVDIPVDEKISNILDRSTLMKRGKCPKCQRKEVEMRYEWCLDPTNTFEGYIKPDPPNDVCCMEGQRSGKSTKTAMYATWVLHRYLNLANPTKYFGLLEAVGALHGTFVSVTAKQAWENLWQPFSDLIDSSPWFKTYHNWLQKKGAEVGMSLYHKPDTYLWYGHKRLALSFAPADQRTLRGRTRFLSAVDEVGWFGASKDRSGTSRVRADGDGTIRALDRSLATIRNASRKFRKRRQNTPDGYQFTISSPSSATDPIMRRVKKALRSPRMYSIVRKTWESNPTFTEIGLREQEGDVSERDFLCDFACNPPYSDDPWWENETALLDICARKDERLWNGSVEFSKDPMGSSRYLYYKFSSIVGDSTMPRCLAFDNGEKHNSFAWALGRFDKQADTVIVDDVGEVAPGENEKIHHGLMWEHVIEPLVQRFRFLHAAWDRWESTRYVADLRTKYLIRAEQYSPTTKDGKQLKSDMLNSKIILPMPEMPISKLPIDSPCELARTPRAHLLLQVLTSRDGNGLPLKPQGANDDILRAVVLLDRFIRDNTDQYGRYSHYGGGRCVGIGVGGAMGGSTRGVGLVVGHGGRVLGVGARR